MSSLVLNNIECKYAGRVVFRDISYRFAQRRVTGILGPNGSGKTTLLRAILGITKPSLGAITIDDKDIRDYSHKQLARMVAYVPQRVGDLGDFLVEDVIAMGRYPYSGIASSGENSRLLSRIMEQTDCLHLQGRACRTLSGGELQRVIIAKALMQEPRFLLLDEPTANLDMGGVIAFKQLISRITVEDEAGTIVVSHDIPFLRSVSDEIILLTAGRIAVSGTPDEVITPANLSEAFNLPANLCHV